MITIVFVLHNLGIGGPQRLVLDLATRLPRDRYKISIISLTPDIFLTCNYNLSGINIEILSKHPYNKIFSCATYLNIKLFMLLRRLKPDIVHSHLWNITCLSVTISSLFLRNIKWVHTIHTSGGYYTGTSIHDFVYRFSEILPQKINCSHIIAISASVADVAERFYTKSKKTLIFNGIDTDRFFYSSRNRDVASIIYVARNQKSKGHMFLIKVMKQLVQKHPFLKLILIGDGLECEYKSEIENLELSGNVVFLGGRSDIPELLAMSEIGVFPSLFEGMPLALCEMMSSGLPIIAFDIPPVREVLGDSGIISPIENIDKLAANIDVLLNDKKLRSDLGEKSRRRVCNFFSIENSVMKHDVLYKSLTP